MFRLREFSVQGEETREDYERIREVMQTLGATICLDSGHGIFQRVVGIFAEPPASVEYIEKQAQVGYDVERRITCSSLNGESGMAELEIKIRAELEARNLTDIKLQPYQQHLPIS